MELSELENAFANPQGYDFDTVYRRHFLDMPNKEQILDELLINIGIIQRHKTTIKQFLIDLKDFLPKYVDTIDKFLESYSTDEKVSTPILIDPENFDYLIINSGYTSRIPNRIEKRTFDELDIGIGKRDGEADPHDDINETTKNRFKNRGAIYIEDKLNEGIVKIGKCNDFDELTDITQSNDFSGVIVFHCYTMVRALEIFNFLKSVNFCGNFDSLTNIRAIELSNGKKVVIFENDAESG